MGKASAVILTCDRPELFRRALGSVMGQTVEPEEVVVVDASADPANRDAVRGLCESHGALYIGTDTGGGAGRNLGAAACGGEFIAFLDDDDEWLPGKLESQLAAAGDACLVCSDYIIESAEGEELFTPSDDPRACILGENRVGCTSMPLVRRSAFEAVGGFDPRMSSNQEWDLWIRMLAAGEAAIDHTAEGIKHASSDGISCDPGLRSRGWIRLLAKHMPLYLSRPRQLERALWFFQTEMVSLDSVAWSVVGLSMYGCVRVPMIVLDLMRGIDVNRRSS